METFAEKLTEISLNLEKETYVAFHQNLTEEELTELEKIIDAYCYDYIVSADVKSFYHHTLIEKKDINEIRVTGVLEKLVCRRKTYEDYNNQYRIIVNESTYVYFSLENIKEFGTYGKNKTFKGGQSLVIGLKF
jgi:hypothetical protein